MPILSPTGCMQAAPVMCSQLPAMGGWGGLSKLKLTEISCNLQPKLSPQTYKLSITSEFLNSYVRQDSASIIFVWVERSILNASYAIIFPESCTLYVLKVSI